MDAQEVDRARVAAASVASVLGLRADEVVLLHNSNRVALRLLPCDVLARVAPAEPKAAAAWRAQEGLYQPGPAFEVEIARRLAETDSPVAGPAPRVEPRVYVRDGFEITLWSYHEPLQPEAVEPREYAQALERLHAGMRRVDMAAPHFTDRVAEAQWLVGHRSRTPRLADADRTFLGDTLRNLRRTIGDRCGAEQLLHGEPHPGNLLRTERGLLFIDFETCCRGPVEFDLAHAPEAVADCYGAVDQDLLRECRALVLAMITTWRWEPDDQLPNGANLGREWLSQLRSAVDDSPET
jgi:Phosphotransferase enzyme family